MINSNGLRPNNNNVKKGSKKAHLWKMISSITTLYVGHFSFAFTSQASNRPRKNKKINIIRFMYVDMLTYENDFFTCMHRVKSTMWYIDIVWMTKSN